MEEDNMQSTKIVSWHRLGGFLCMLVLSAHGANADSWPPAQPESFYSENKSVMVRISPVLTNVGSLYNQSKPGTNPFAVNKSHCKLELLEKSQDGTWRQKIQGELLNVIRPISIFIANDGQSLVTVDDYGRKGYQHALTFYRTKDKLEVVRDATIDEFLTSAELTNNVMTTISSRHWTEKAKYFFEDENFVIVTWWKRKIVFSLQSGTVVSVKQDKGTKTTGEPCPPSGKGPKPFLTWCSKIKLVSPAWSPDEKKTLAGLLGCRWKIHVIDAKAAQTQSPLQRSDIQVNLMGADCYDQKPNTVISGTLSRVAPEDCPIEDSSYGFIRCGDQAATKACCH